MMPPLFIVIFNLLLEGPHIIDHIPDIIICYLPLIFWHFAPAELGFVKMDARLISLDLDSKTQVALIN